MNEKSPVSNLRNDLIGQAGQAGIPGIMSALPADANTIKGPCMPETRAWNTIS